MRIPGKPSRPNRLSRRRRWVGLTTVSSVVATAALVAASIVAAPTPASSAAGECVTTTTSTYTASVCLGAPASGATVTGDVTVTASVTIKGTSPGLAKTEYALDGQYLLTDFQSPWTFVLATSDFVDGAHVLAVRALMRNGDVSLWTSIPLTFSNGVTSPPVNDRQWQEPSATPRPYQTPTILAAAGDGAGGETQADSIVSMIQGWRPDLFAYTGDVYDDGTLTEFRNWYGTNGLKWSRFNAVTLPVVGNHEYTGNLASGYFHYWDNIPHYYSVDVNGWHIIGLDTTSQFGQTAPGTAQYEWLAADLAANASPCTIVTGHHPLYNIGKELPAERLQPMWQLMAQHGVTMFLVGHDHTYQRWDALDAGGNPATDGVTEVVVGTGGHSAQAVLAMDPRVARYSSRTYGAVRLALYGDHLTGEYFALGGALVDSFTVPCQGTDGLAPDGVTELAASVQEVPDGQGGTIQQVDLSWQPAADNVGVTGYRVSRNGAVMAEVASPGWSDTATTSATDYVYLVESLDAAGNATGATVPVRTGGPDVTPPSVPTGLRASTDSPTTIDIAWDPASDNTDVIAYEVSRDGEVVGSAPGPAFQDTVPGHEQAHVYSVVALDAAGNRSGASDPLSARSQDLAAPEPPTDLTATVDGAAVHLAWSAPTTGVAVTGYVVERDGQQVTQVSGTSWIDTASLSLQTPAYRVRSVSAAGVPSDPCTAVSVTIGDTAAPTPPGGVSATAGGPNLVTVAWQPSTDDSAVTGYVISRDGAVVGSVGGDVTTWTDLGVLSETGSSYQVLAKDAAGNASSASTAATVTTPAVTPSVASADTYANAASPDTRYPTAVALRLDGDPMRRPYIALPLGSGGPGQTKVARARLRVYVESKLIGGFLVYGVPATWTEKTLTWNNAPSPASPSVASGSVGAATWVDVDVTILAASLGPGSTLAVTLVSSSGTSVSVSSRETTREPSLLVDWAP